MMESTAYLVGSDAAYIELALQSLPARQPDVQQDYPVSRHLEPEICPVLTRLGLCRFSKYGSHARV